MIGAEISRFDLPTICIAVCTRNRATSLKATLSQLDGLRRPTGWKVELLVVDNGSTDSTCEILSVFKQQTTLPMRVLMENRAGLSKARNVVLTATTADVIAFTDDDCFPQENWLLAISAYFSDQRAAAVIGGRVELFDTTDLPITINTSLEPLIIDHPTMELTSVMGCNLAFSRQVVECVGLFDETFGAGAPFISAEDTDYLYRALIVGFPILYCPDVVVYHNHGRKLPEDRDKLMRGYGIGRGAMYFKHWRLGDRLALRSLYWEVRRLLIAVIHPRTDRESRVLCLGQVFHVLSGFFKAVLSH